MYIILKKKTVEYYNRRFILFFFFENVYSVKNVHSLSHKEIRVTHPTNRRLGLPSLHKAIPSHPLTFRPKMSRQTGAFFLSPALIAFIGKHP